MREEKEETEGERMEADQRNQTREKSSACMCDGFTPVVWWESRGRRWYNGSPDDEMKIKRKNERRNER